MIEGERLAEGKTVLIVDDADDEAPYEVSAAEADELARRDDAISAGTFVDEAEVARMIGRARR